jgi:hypothetical protein
MAFVHKFGTYGSDNRAPSKRQEALLKWADKKAAQGMPDEAIKRALKKLDYKR